jgi:hypothetical protein
MNPIEKVAQLAGVLDVHPATFLFASFLSQEDSNNRNDLIRRIETELMQPGRL